MSLLQINEWLANPKRDYRTGVNLFKLHAPEHLKLKYLAFIDDGDGTVTSSEYNMLINKLVAVVQNGNVVNQDTPLSTEAKPEDDTEINPEPVSSFGFKAINDETNLPNELAEKYARIKELVPLMASLHNDLANEELETETAKTLTDELLAMEEEKASLWDEIDNWSVDKKIDEDTTVISRVEFSGNEVIKGAQIARRILQLKQNITRAKTTIETGKSEKVKANAAENLTRYELELESLANLLPPTDE